MAGRGTTAARQAHDQAANAQHSLLPATQVGARVDLDDFPTPPWATVALCEHILGAQSLRDAAVWEVTANRGYMVRPLREYARDVRGSDVYDYGAGFDRFDFMSLAGGLQLDGAMRQPFEGEAVDWIITNPPFAAALEFFELAWRAARVGVAFLLRTQILEGGDRYRRIYDPLRRHWTFAQFAERVPMVQGRVDPSASSATAYGWLVAWKAEQAAEFLLDRRHIPPCRAQFEHPSDYRSRA